VQTKCDRCEGSGTVTWMPDGHETECPDCEGAGVTEWKDRKMGDIVERLRKHTVRRRDGTARPPARIVLEAANEIEKLQLQLLGANALIAEIETLVPNWRAYRNIAEAVQMALESVES
jgi:hypothetical protein